MLATVLMLVFVACGQSNNEAPVSTEAPTATTAPTEKVEPMTTTTPTATATPEPTATTTPEPTATATPEPTATATPEPTAGLVAVEGHLFTVRRVDEIMKSTLPLAYDDSKKAAITYIMAMLTGEFDVVLDMSTACGSLFVDSVDIGLKALYDSYDGYGVYRPIYIFYDGKRVYLEVSEETTYGDEVYYVLELFEENGNKIESFELYTCLNEKGEWHVREARILMYLENRILAAPSGNVKVTVDGVELGDEYKDGTTGLGDVMTLYRIPNLPVGDIPYTLESDSFTYEGTFNSWYDGNLMHPYTLTPQLDFSYAEEVAAGVEEAWNKLYSYCCNNSNGRNLGSVLADSISEDEYEDIYNMFYNGIVAKTKNLKLSNVKAHSYDSPYMAWYADDTIYVSVTYDLDYEMDGETKHAFKMATVLVTKTDDGYVFSYADDNMLSSVEDEFDILKDWIYY